MLTGEDVRIFDAAELHAPAASVSAPATDLPAEVAPAAQAGGAAAAQPPAGYGVEYDYHASHSEFEQTSFAANGVIKTTDGKEIRFDLQLEMSRSYHEESDVSLRLGDATRQKKDPLVLNFAGTAAQLGDQRFKFDLDADGTAESINRLASGSGFLTLDRNHDGRINNGGELFGTRSGDGFADLATLDGDGNGWIDENDAAFAQLGVWTPDANGGGKVQSLKEANVGALSLARVATPYDLRDGSNQTLGQIRSSGVFLQDVEEVPDGLRQSLPVQGQRGLDLTTGCCAITHGERTQRSFKQARRLRHRLPDEREITATTRTDGRFGQARTTRRAAIQRFRHRGSTGGRQAHPSPLSGRRPIHCFGP
jgi:hypothetical protein